MTKNIQIKLLSDHSIIPKRQHELDIGYDLHCSENTEIPSKKVTRVETGISISLLGVLYWLGKVDQRKQAS